MVFYDAIVVRPGWPPGGAVVELLNRGRGWSIIDRNRRLTRKRHRRSGGRNPVSRCSINSKGSFGMPGRGGNRRKGPFFSPLKCSFQFRDRPELPSKCPRPAPSSEPVVVPSEDEWLSAAYQAELPGRCRTPGTGARTRSHENTASLGGRRGSAAWTRRTRWSNVTTSMRPRPQAGQVSRSTLGKNLLLAATW